MAEKILKIRLEVDTTDSKKLTNITTEVEKNLNQIEGISNRLQLLEAKRLALLNEQQQAIAKTQVVISKLNNLQETGILNQKLSYNAANTSALALSKTLQTNLDLQRKLSLEAANFKLLTSSSLALTASPKQPAEKFTRTNNNINTGTVGFSARNPLTGQSIISEEEKARKIAKIKEAISASSNAILEQQTKDRLNHEVEINRLAQQKAINSQSFAQRLNSTPRVSYQGSQIDITGTLSRYLKDQAVATNLTNEAQKRLNASLDQAGEKHRSLVTRIIEGVSIYRVYNTALNTVLNSLRAIPEIGIQLEATKSILTATVGSEASVNSVLSQLNKEAERTGISVAVLRESFRTFNASALLAGETTETAYRIFTNLNTTITSLHLSTDLAQHTFLAFSQILNKGKVQSEELVKQLGNLLPGAFATMAKALNISTQELSKRMKQGLVTAHDSLDAFAQEYAKQFSQSFIIAQQGLNSNIGRLQTSFTLLGESIYSQTNGAMIGFVKGLTSITNEFRAVIEGTSKWNSELSILKTTIELIAFTAISASLAKFSKGLVVTQSAMAALTGTVSFTTVAIGKLKTALSFLSGPTVIVASILAIANQLKEVIIPAETLIDKLRAARKEAEDLVKQNAQRASLSEAGKITFDIDNSEEVKTKFNDIKKLAEELEATKERLTNSKFNPFASINDIQKDKEFIRQGTAELKLQLKEFEKIKEEKRLQLNIDALAAKNKETDFSAVAAAREAEQAEKALAKIKEINFGKETAYNDKLRKDLEAKYKYQLDVIQAKEKELELIAKRASAEGNEVPNNQLASKLNDLQQQELELKAQYQKKFEAIAIDSQNRIYKSATDKNRLTFEQFYKGLQDIESAGVKTRGGREGAVSITGALGRGQVQPSTLNDFTKNVPDDILALEKKARFNLNVLKKKVTLEPAEIERLRDFALANVDKINEVSEKLFKKLVDDFGGDFIKAAVAYNTGPARVKLASASAAKAGREDFESFLPTSGKLGLNPRALAEAQNYAKLARNVQGGDNFNAALLDKQTEQQAAIDAQRTVAQDKRLLSLQKELDLSTQLKDRKETERQIEIELLAVTDKSKEAEIEKVRAEFAERYALAVKQGSEFSLKRLPVLEAEKLKQIELKDLQSKFNENERVFQAQVQEYTNKSLVGRVKNFQIAEILGKLESEYIDKQRTNLEQSLKQTTSLEQQLSIKQQLALLEQKQSESAAFNRNFVTPPEVNDFASNAAKIEQSRSDDLSLATLQFTKDLNARKIEAEIQFQERKKQIEEKYAIASRVNLEVQYAAGSAYAASAFGVIASAASDAFGQQSEAARAAFALQKAFLVAEAIMTAEKAALAAEASGNAINPALGIVFAALSYASTAAKIATIIATPIPSAGAAHGGLENVPKEQTYLLDKGERVLSPRQNVDITNKVTNINDRIGKQAPANNIRIVNVMDENLVYNALGSDQSEKIIMNIVNRNR